MLLDYLIMRPMTNLLVCLHISQWLMIVQLVDTEAALEMQLSKSSEAGYRRLNSWPTRRLSLNT